VAAASVRDGIAENLQRPGFRGLCLRLFISATRRISYLGIVRIILLPGIAGRPLVVQRQHNRQHNHPMRYVMNSAGGGRWSETDELASEVARVVKGRNEIGYSDRSELESWLDDARVDYDAASLDRAVEHLLGIGRLAQPDAREWTRPGRRPTWYVPQ
jgi:hypothetical protein